jgi:hypothetical protein
MRAKALLVLLGTTALGAYTIGRHSSPVHAPVAAVAQPRAAVANPVAFTTPVSPAIAAAASAVNNPVHTIKSTAEKATATRDPAKAASPEMKRKLRSR